MLKELQVYGRDEDVANLVTLLLNNVNSEEGISICPVLGIGGLGKTTLAQLVYNHDWQTITDFDVKIWVFVSEDFDLRKITREILVSLSGNTAELETLDALQRSLQEKLVGKRFLLVLDDVWEDNQDKWDKLLCSLRCGAKGSSVIVTTRLETVAAITGTVPTYHLEKLSDDDCWCLFKQHAFGPGNEEKPELVKIGKAIVQKCGGVPLAAKALGGLLRFSNEEKRWLSVRDGEIWDIPESSDAKILPALRLSYNNLPSHLKQCFAYCSIFPKHHVIEKEELIHLWMANGLVQPQGMELEEVGNETFNALLWRSLFQDTTKDEDGNIKTCKMHGLVHDLACYVAMDECSVMMAQNITKKTRHLSVLFSTEESSSKFDCVANSSPWLRSLISLNGWSHKQSPQFTFSSLKCMRALNLRHAAITVLPKSIGQMKHLRYLNLSNTLIRSLPKSICVLRNMQTLKLKHCYRLQTLPKNMSKMCSLRHLDIQGCERLTKTPKGMGQLTSLRTLSIFIVGLESGCGIKELQGLNLEGEMEIKGIDYVKSSLEAREANLVRKQDLCSLRLSWEESHVQDNVAEIIEGLQPHSNIKRLVIKQYGGRSLPSWLTLSYVPNLVEISLFQCRGCQHFPPLEKLPLLKVLKIHSMTSLRFMSDGQSVTEGFLSLEELSLSRMPRLEVWVSRTRADEGSLLPRLKRLILKECPKLTGVIFPPSLEYAYLRNCSEMVLGLLQNLPSLSSLELSHFEEVFFFPEEMLGNLPALQKLDVRSCYNLKTLPVQLESISTLTNLSIVRCTELVSFPTGLRNLYSLVSLRIYECLSLQCLAELEMSSLEDVDIYDCPELEFSMTDFQPLVFLRTLSLCMLPKLISLPKGLKYAANLQNLSIVGCLNMMELPDWISSLVSLQTLQIEGCKNLKVLPDGLEHLTDLQNLEIEGCDPELERRCEEDKGQDWHKISHVPHVLIKS